MTTAQDPNTFHSANRKALVKAMGHDAIGIVDTADILTRPGDYEYPFRADSNFFYLTGIAEPESVLILAPEHIDPRFREILFVTGTSDFQSTWEGERLTVTEALKISGIETVLPLGDLEPILSRLMSKYAKVFLNSEESLSAHTESPALRRARSINQSIPTKQLYSMNPLVEKLRMIKNDEEIKNIRQAIEVTKLGLLKVFATVKPGLFEYHLDAEITAEFIRNGTRHAFEPIVAAGRSSTVIHHMKNDGPISAGDVVLLDIGAAYHHYSADISRVLPADGSFSVRQRAVYDAVLRLQKVAYSLLKPGTVYSEYEQELGNYYLDELLGLKVISASERRGSEAQKVLRQHYPHRTSHFLGLDTHDVGDYSLPLQPGMVLTVEPGIYLRDEAIGIRLEDVVLITETGCEVLSKGIPSDPSEVETLVQSRLGRAKSH
jgi:Xaa-Pro aminopeptidase